MAEISCWRIANWNEHFENNRTRDMKTMAWVPIQNKLDGDGYTELVDHKNGAPHYAAWTTLVLIASRCDPRGTLLRAGSRPHDFASLARISRFPEALFREAIPRLIGVGWLETVILSVPDVTAKPQDGAAKPQEDAAKPHDHALNGKKERTEGKEGNTPVFPEELSCPEFEAAWGKWDRHRRQIKKPLTSGMIESQLKELAAMGKQRAIAMIEYTIFMGWQGLREREASSGAPARRKLSELVQ